MAVSIEDRLAIQDCFTRYATALDGGDIEGVVRCFTPNASMKNPVLGVRSGLLDAPLPLEGL